MKKKYESSRHEKKANVKIYNIKKSEALSNAMVSNVLLTYFVEESEGDVIVESIIEHEAELEDKKKRKAVLHRSVTMTERRNRDLCVGKREEKKRICVLAFYQPAQLLIVALSRLALSHDSAKSPSLFRQPSLAPCGLLKFDSVRFRPFRSSTYYFVTHATRTNRDASMISPPPTAPHTRIVKYFAIASRKRLDCRLVSRNQSVYCIFYIKNEIDTYMYI